MKIYFDSIGCRLNQSEIETYANQFRGFGHEIVHTPAEADLVVVNTCAVTAEAASDSRQKVRQAVRAGAKSVAVTGCWSTLNPQEAAQLPGVYRVIANPQKDHLVSEILNISEEAFDLEPVARQPVPGVRLRTRAFIKAQDGCDNRCTFCVTTIARGPGRSRSLEAVLSDIQSAVQGGAQEIVLTGVHLGSWGKDLGNGDHLTSLIRKILDSVDISRLRLSSVEPWDLDADFFKLWSDPRLCRQLHLPLQSGSEGVLHRMARKTSPQSFADLVRAARGQIADLAITTDMIVGFPGETEAEFQESLEFVERMQFAGGHVFTYSARPGTAAARFPGRINGKVIRERSSQMRAVIEQSSQAFRQTLIGQTLPVLWETAQGLGPEGWHLSGLTDNYVRVATVGPQDLWNQVTHVRLTGIDGEGMSGVLEGGN